MLPVDAPLVMRGEVGIPRGAVDPIVYEHLEKQLTRVAVSYTGTETAVSALRDDDPDFLWVPRYYERALWERVNDWRWSDGREFAFTRKVNLDPDRGQVDAVPVMVEHVRRESSGVLIAPTGTGKTLMGYSVAAEFGRFIGIPVYVGHMIDNWVEHAKFVLGLTDDQIGFVQGDRCDLGRPVTIMMIQSLLGRRYPQELYDQIGFLICDEVHRYGAEVWKNVVSQFPARYRLGLTAKLSRRDGLEDFVNWSFGRIGHRARRIRGESITAPSAYVLQFTTDYDFRKYCRWAKNEETGEWEPSDPHPTKYDKLLAADEGRNRRLAEEIVNAAKTGRQVLVLSSLVEHLETLRELTWRALEEIHPVERIVKNIPYPASRPFLRLDTLSKGLKAKKGGPNPRDRVADADVIFATYQMGRDALNLPKLDTLVLATPPGDVTQPIGRLREKSEGYDRRPLLVLDAAEPTLYSQNKLRARERQYAALGMAVRHLKRAS